MHRDSRRMERNLQPENLHHICDLSFTAMLEQHLVPGMTWAIDGEPALLALLRTRGPTFILGQSALAGWKWV